MRGRLTGVPAAKQRVRTKERLLAEAKANPTYLSDVPRLVDEVWEARRLLAVAEARAEADVRIAKEKAIT
jgi:hypothetical protein